MKICKKMLCVMLTLIICLSVVPMTDLGVKASAAYENTYTNTGNQRDDIIGVAKTQVGYEEGSNNYNKYGLYFGNNNTAWCAYFIVWCARQANIDSTIIKKTGWADADDLGVTYKAKGTYTPQKGDIIIFDYEPRSNKTPASSYGDHVGLVEYVSNGYVHTIEGNANNGVRKYSYSLNNSDIKGYGIPKYETQSYTIAYDISLDYNTVDGKFYDSNTAEISIVPQIDGRKATDSEINSITLKVKYPNGTVKSMDLGNNTSREFYLGNGAAGTYIFWADVDTIYGSYEGGVGDSDVSINLSRLSFTNGTYDEAVKYMRIQFEDLDRYLTVDSSDNVVSNERINCSSSNQSQVWKLIKNSDNTYTIESVENGKVLDAYKGNLCQGTDVTVYTSQNSENQKWYLSKNSNGEWFIRAAASNSAVLDIKSADVANGTNIRLWTYNGTSAQKVTFMTPYNITYNANGGSGAPSTQYKNYDTTITLGSTKPTRSGYTFLGWSTSSSATSASYSAGASYSSNADLNLYAVWKKNPTYTLSYSANGGGGAPSSQTGASSYTISSTEPTKTGYTFRGWAKSSSATTATYKSGDTINISENTTLYAVWKKVFYGDVNSDNVISDTDLLLLNKIALGKVEADCINKLKGDLDGDEKITSDDVQYLGNFLAKIDNKFPVESMFNDFVVTNNGKQTYKSGEAINKSEITAFVTYNNANYHTIDEGLTVSPEYASGSGQQKITVTLGDWSDYFYITVDNTVGYTLSYNANGGSGAPSNQTGSTSYTVSSTVPTRNGYTFLGWAKSSSATTPAYKPGNNISVSANTTLYAVWSSASAISTGSSYSTSVEFANQERYYTFTPSTSGDYIFESTGSLDTKVYVYNTSWNELGNDDDDGADSNFMLKINLTAGTKYYVKVRAYSSKTGSTSFSVKKEAPVTYTLNYNANGGSNAPSSQTGSTTYAISSTVPTRQGYTFLGWAKSSNASIAPYTPGDIVTLTTDTTLYAVWKVAEAMEVFEGYEVSIDFAKQELYYTFTPDVSGEYMFESFSSIDTKVYVYDSSWKQIGFNDDDGVGNNFLLYVNLTAGNKYYVKVGAYGSGTGALTFGVACEEEEHEHSYSSTVTKQPGCVSYGTREFKCSCGDTYTETINPLGHNFETEWTIDKKATCTEDGKKSHHCVRCDIGSAEETIKATGHDFDGSKCKNCDYDKSSDCSCNCHKGGIARFFFKLILFFQKIFGSNKTCVCGRNHY